MIRTIKQIILNYRRPLKLSGFVVEKLDNDQVSGWIIPQDGQDPKVKNFHLIEKGLNVGLQTRLFHRPVFVKQKEHNLYGFRIRFKQEVNNLRDAVLFYGDDDVFAEPRFLDKVDTQFSLPSSPVYFLNRMVLQLKVNSKPLPSAETLKPLLPDKQVSSLDVESMMTELASETLTSCQIQTGVRSKCGVAIIGRGGHLFLHCGSNRVDELFQNNDVHREKAADWLALYEKRQTKAVLSGYQCLQFVIPEKQSLLGDRYYRDVSGPSELLQDIEKTELSSYCSVLQALAKYSHQELFFKTDSHLSAEGTFCLFKALLTHLGLNILVEPEFNKRQQVNGDLGRKFKPITLWEEYQVTTDVIKSNRQVKHKFVPENKTHMGRHIHWINSSAVFNQKVLIFGNSFCDMGSQQHHLTWWFSHYFTECQFVWFGEFNDKLIEKSKADIVIGQSVERFLRLVPRF
jgi:hypothetical protein